MRGAGVRRVEFYYDLVSPYSYLANCRIRRICAERGVELALRPILDGGVHKAVGLQAPIEVEQKARYQRRDVERWAEYYCAPRRRGPRRRPQGRRRPSGR
jgi:2-hydroxychromene-2-carboxylate isomerase